MTTEQRIEFLEARLAVTEQTLHQLMTLVMPAVGLIANETGARLMQIHDAMEAARIANAESSERQAANLEAVQESIASISDQLQELTKDAEEGEEWKRGNPDA